MIKNIVEKAIIPYNPAGYNVQFKDRYYLFSQVGIQYDKGDGNKFLGDDGKYHEIIANPIYEATDELEKIQIDRVVYSIPKSVNGGGSNIDVDNELSLSSENPVQNKVVAEELNKKASVEYVNEKFNGANKAVSFINYSSMISSLNALPSTSYSVNQNIMIVTLKVPDLWISEITETSMPYTYVSDTDFVSELEANGFVQVGYFKLSALETQKVDLTDYVKNTDYAEVNKYGLVKLGNYASSGFEVKNDGTLGVYYARANDLKNKTNNTVVTAYNIPRAVKEGLIDAENGGVKGEWTNEERAKARQTLGINDTDGLTEEQENKLNAIKLNGEADKFLNEQGEYKEIKGITVDSSLSSTSSNPVQNSVITGALNEYVKNAIENDSPSFEFIHSLTLKSGFTEDYDDFDNGNGATLKFSTQNKNALKMQSLEEFVEYYNTEGNVVTGTYKAGNYGAVEEEITNISSPGQLLFITTENDNYTIRIKPKQVALKIDINNALAKPAGWGIYPFNQNGSNTFVFDIEQYLKNKTITETNITEVITKDNFQTIIENYELDDLKKFNGYIIMPDGNIEYITVYFTLSTNTNSVWMSVDSKSGRINFNTDTVVSVTETYTNLPLTDSIKKIIATDVTLTREGVPADAKATGEAIQELREEVKNTGSGIRTLETAPDLSTEGYAGEIVQVTNGTVYQCTAITEGSYTWIRLIKETDYATTNDAGIVKIGSGLVIEKNGNIRTALATTSTIDGQVINHPVAMPRFAYAVKQSLIDPNKSTAQPANWTNEERAKARATLGATALYKHTLTFTFINNPDWLPLVIEAISTSNAVISYDSHGSFTNFDNVLGIVTSKQITYATGSAIQPLMLLDIGMFVFNAAGQIGNELVDGYTCSLVDSVTEL